MRGFQLFFNDKEQLSIRRRIRCTLHPPRDSNLALGYIGIIGLFLQHPKSYSLKKAFSCGDPRFEKF